MEIEDKFKSSDFVTARNDLKEKLLYKYRSISNEKEKSIIKDVILNHRVRFSRPSELNDPIEGKPIYKFGDLEDLKYLEQFEQWAWNTQKILPNPPKQDDFLSWFRTLTIEQHREKVNDIVKGNQEVIESKWRIFSLSSTPVSELLWAHYGNSHKGIALVFDASHGEFGVAMKVTYLEKRKIIDITSQDIFDILFATILTKRKAWKYEDEYRCVAPEPWEPPFPILDSQFMAFEPENLVGVVFGTRMENELKDEILSWSKDRIKPLSFWQTEILESGDIKCVKIQL